MTPRSAPATPAPDRSSPALAVVGFLMALAALLNANPRFGIHPMWPWQMLAESEAALTVKAVALVWMFTAVWLLVLSFGGWYRLRSTVALMLGLVLLFELEGVHAGMQIQRFLLNEFMALVGIGAGLLLARGDATKRTGRYLCAVSVLALVVSWAVGFEAVAGRARLIPRFEAFAHEVQVFVTGEGRYWAERARDPGYPWHTLLPQLVTFAAAAGALLVALGLRARGFLTALFVGLLVAMAAPLGVRVVRVIEGGDPGFTSIALHVFNGLVEDGLVIWLLVCYAIADLVRPPGTAPTPEAAR